MSSQEHGQSDVAYWKVKGYPREFATWAEADAFRRAIRRSRATILAFARTGKVVRGNA